MLVSIIGALILNKKFQLNQSSLLLHIQDTNEKINLFEDEKIHEQEALKSFKQKIIISSKLKDITEKLSLCLTLEDTAKALTTSVSEVFPRDDVTMIFYLFHGKTGELGLKSSQKGQMKINLKNKKGDEFDRWVVKTMQGLLIENVKSDYRFDIDQITTRDARTINSLISVPMCIGTKALGIIRLDSPHPQKFSAQDLRFLTTVADIGAVAIENAQLYDRLENLAIRDSLTGLFLRRYLMERIAEEMNRRKKGADQLGFLIIDIDYFKKYNDQFGHVAGDIVLKTLGKVMLDFFNEPGHFVCRYGGEEFCVLIPHTSKSKVLKMAQNFREHVASQTINLRRKKTQVTVSIGVACYPQDAEGKDTLILKADQALYRAKEKGRNQVCGN